MAVVDGGLLPLAEIDSLMVKFGRMSALGHKRTFRIALAMSALSPKADISGKRAEALSLVTEQGRAL